MCTIFPITSSVSYVTASTSLAGKNRSYYKNRTEQKVDIRLPYNFVKLRNPINSDVS